MIKTTILLIGLSFANFSYANSETLENNPSRYTKIVSFFKTNVNKSLGLAEQFVQMQQKEYVLNKYNQMTVSILEQSSNYLGTPYVWGGSSENGVDCSGLILQIFKNSLNIELPRTSLEMSKIGERIKNFKDLLPGDLVFFNTRNFSFSHVGIYIGDNKFIHSPRTGAYVRLDDLNHNYWQTRFNGARRLLHNQALSLN